VHEHQYALYCCLCILSDVLQEEVDGVFGAVEKRDIKTIDQFIKKYGINNIRDDRLGVSK